MKRLDLSASTSRWLSHMSPRLRNNGVTRGKHTLVHFTAQTPLRMHAGRGVEQPKTSSRLLSLRCTLLIYRATSLRWLQICARPSPTSKLAWLWLWWCHKYHVTAITQRMFGRGQEVDNPLVSLASAGSLFDDDRVLCDTDDLPMKAR